jgi:hypothetical protein
MEHNHMSFYADYVNMLDQNINILKKNTEALSDASKEVVYK